MSEAALPALRPELVLAPAGPTAAGEPSWTLHDPARNAYFQLDWLTYELLSRWDLQTPHAVLEAVSAETTLEPSEQDLAGVVRFLVESELVAASALSAAALAERARRRAVGPFTWLLHNYLFMRIPLVRPDRWLAVAARWLGFLYGRGFLLATLAALGLGVWQVSRQWETFRTTFVDHLSPEGAVRYALVLVFVKVIHELGHAITAKRYGCRVPTMGMAFLVLWPVAYTDTSDAWKLTDRRQRLAISSAGVLAELALACWALALWPLLPDGPVRTAAFLIASATWITTLAVNLNPLMRFDGYYILSDLLNVPNLQSRAFAVARWQVRRTLLASPEPAPDDLPPALRRRLVALAWAIWIYRLGLYIGIALLVYHFFIKIVGILLFAVEMWWFILRPVFAEMKTWWESRRELLRRPRARAAMVAPLALLGLATLPLPERIVTTAVFQPTDLHVVRAPSAGRLAELTPAGPSPVRAGAVLVRIDSPQVVTSEAVSRADVLRAEAKARVSAMQESLRSEFSVSQTELSSAEAALRTAETARERLELRAPFTGKVVEVEPDLKLGDWVQAGERLAVLSDERRWQATAYLTEEQVAYLTRGARAKFFPDAGAGEVIELKVAQVSADRTYTLPSGLWATANGGSVPAHLKDGAWTSEQPLFRVVLEADEAPSEINARTWRGRVGIEGRPESPVLRSLRRVAAVVIREAGF